ncbi:hypothetical protein ABZV77_32475 [Streptomyces sp. NPDC004732]|uniref:hypothetical protein n=1 Tax=Streptomyces sp. NPDC004732 TaxID=3154290 RepID=UPI0033B28471
MLNPIDPDAVIREGGAIGRYPGEIHEGVAWWVGACFVVALKADRVVVAHGGNTTSAAFHRRLCRGAVNARHFACTVADLRVATEAGLLTAMEALGSVPGALVTTTDEGDAEVVHIALYDAEGQSLTEGTGLAAIRRMIAENRVPIPVNAAAKGRVERYVRQPTGEGGEE